MSEAERVEAETPLPKGEMVQPRVWAQAAPDQPNAARHAELRASWEPGQAWETLVAGCARWVPVSIPSWDNNQEYRRVE